MKKTSLIIATRESPLALWQANWVKQQLEKHYPFLSIHLLGMTTSADNMLTTPLYKVGGKGLFVKELEEALLDGRADIAVHSMKDVPMDLPQGLCVPVMCEREDPRDAFVSNQFANIEDLPEKAVIGTSSLRRQSQILAMRPDLQTGFLRGNVNTRLAKLDNKDYAAIILAAAGLKRLNFSERIRTLIHVDDILPAAGQGVLGIECRSNDRETENLIRVLNHETSHTAVLAERAMCRYLGGGCHVPIGSFAEIVNDQILLRALVASNDGKRILRVKLTGNLADAEELGTQAAKNLIAQGARELLA